ncbi:MAG: hypothetical protein LBU42_05015 [Prevotellaceae bacterium]|jgi:uncharacterized protein (TIGR02145 family)|nr:hypothetical protein [Prevotellaceae bacterium]
MKKIFFLLAMLASVAASATVTVTPLSTDYSENKVTFKVEWTNTPSAPYNNRVWVWIDFYPVTGATPANSFSTATISNLAKTGGNGTITNVTARGFFIEYAATNTGATVTATLSNASGKFNWCAYGSDYPPNVLANTSSSYTLAGTPPFKLIASNGTTEQTVTGMIIATSAVTFTPATITDATGYPGLWCPYTGSDLYMDISHRCLQRQSGAKNWEAYIKDARDSELYRIVKMPDNKWWLAQNVKYASAGYAISGCTEDDCGRAYTYAQAYASYAGGTSASTGNVQGICPPGWLLPIATDWSMFVNSISSNSSVVAERLRSLNSSCTPVTDYYGWANKMNILDGHTLIYNGVSWYLNECAGDRHWGLRIDSFPSNLQCDYVNTGCTGNLATRYANVRCFRQL